MNLQETKAKLEKYNQSQLLKYYDELDENQRQSLLKQIDEIDFDLLKLIEDGGKEIEKGVIETECKKILQQFFKELREKKKK